MAIFSPGVAIMRQTQWYYLWDLEVSILGLESSSKLESLTDSEELGRGN